MKTRVITPHLLSNPPMILSFTHNFIKIWKRLTFTCEGKSQRHSLLTCYSISSSRILWTPTRWLLFPTFYRIPLQNCCKYDTVSKPLHWMCYVSISYWFFLIQCIKHTWQGGMGHEENLPNIFPVLIRGYIEIYYYFCMKGAYETYYLPIPFTYHVI